jgi:hypothetical protein
LIPELRDDGYLPEGVHVAELEEIVARFGNTPRRSRLIARIRNWVGLARSIGAQRLLLAGSFVSAKLEFFTRTRESDARTQGVIEVKL